MEITKIELLNTTDKECFVKITFKTFFGSKEKICIKPSYNINTYYVSNGKDIPVLLWGVVEAFIRTGDKVHDYLNLKMEN